MMMKINRKILLPFFLITLVTLACGVSTRTATKEPTAPVLQQQVTTVPVMPSLPVALSNEEAILTTLYTRANPSVVNIITYSQQGGMGAASGQGSGFVFDQGGNIVTNAHVIHGADRLEVYFSDDSAREATLVGEDLHSDLAVISVDSLPAGVLSLPLGKMEEVAVGQTVVAIGNPYGLGGTLTKGIVSALGRSIPALTTFQIPQAIQTDAPINPGNSGGPLLNLRGEVIGINAQIETGGTGRANTGVGFAIPVSIVARVIPRLIEDGEFIWPWLGVQGGSVSPILVKAMDLSVDKGAYVAVVLDNGPSIKAGLHGATRQTEVDGQVIEIGGDVIIAIDDQPVAHFEDILIYLALNKDPGDVVVLTVLRDGKTIEIKVTLEPRPTTLSQEESFPFPEP
ncbi:MAG: trypsin-like peptidase domain-containing protein [Anaerolineales bacterium]|nr:trypsin-like peptidase domain-containing protein [Anaerolineales bacterium]